MGERRDTEGVSGLCLDPHDLAISKYVARRDEDRLFNRELARRGLVDRKRLLALVEETPVDEQIRKRIRDDIAHDFARGRKRQTAAFVRVWAGIGASSGGRRTLERQALGAGITR